MRCGHHGRPVWRGPGWVSAPLPAEGLREQPVGPACIPRPRWAVCLGSLPCEVQVRDVAMGTAGLLCILLFSEVSIPPLLPPSCPLLAPLLSPSKAQEVGGYSHQRRRQGRWSVPYSWPMNGCLSQARLLSRGQVHGPPSGPRSSGPAVWHAPCLIDSCVSPEAAVALGRRTEGVGSCWHWHLLSGALSSLHWPA